MSYTLNEIEYPGVTAFLGVLGKGDALNYWAAGCACDYIKENINIIQNPEGPHDISTLLKDAKSAFKHASGEALDIGSQVHNAIEVYIKHGKDLSGNLKGEVQNGFLAFLEWESKNHVEWLESELTLFSTQYGFAGTCDAIAVLNGHKYLIDFKTSKAVYDEHKKQLAAYRLAYNEMKDDDFGNYIENIGILRLDKETGEPEWKDVTKNSDKHETSFLKLVDFYYADKKRRLKNNPFVEKYYS